MVKVEKVKINIQLAKNIDDAMIAIAEERKWSKAQVYRLLIQGALAKGLDKEL